MAEVANFCVPGIADLHNYSAAHSFQQKKYNWDTLNCEQRTNRQTVSRGERCRDGSSGSLCLRSSAKVFKRLAIPLSAREIEGAAAAVPGAVEKIILKFRRQVKGVLSRACCALLLSFEKLFFVVRDSQVAAVTAAAEGGSSPTAALRGSPRKKTKARHGILISIRVFIASRRCCCARR